MKQIAESRIPFWRNLEMTISKTMRQNKKRNPLQKCKSILHIKMTLIEDLKCRYSLPA